MPRSSGRENRRMVLHAVATAIATGRLSPTYAWMACRIHRKPLESEGIDDLTHDRNCLRDVFAGRFHLAAEAAAASSRSRSLARWHWRRAPFVFLLAYSPSSAECACRIGSTSQIRLFR